MLHVQNKLKNEPKTTFINDVMEEYLQYCSFTKRLSEHTLAAYRIDLEQFIKFLVAEFPDICEMDQITKGIIQAYVNYLGEGYTVASVSR